VVKKMTNYGVPDQQTGDYDTAYRLKPNRLIQFLMEERIERRKMVMEELFDPDSYLIRGNYQLNMCFWDEAMARKEVVSALSDATQHGASTKICVEYVGVIYVSSIYSGGKRAVSVRIKSPMIFLDRYTRIAEVSNGKFRFWTPSHACEVEATINGERVQVDVSLRDGSVAIGFPLGHIESFGDKRTLRNDPLYIEFCWSRLVRSTVKPKYVTRLCKSYGDGVIDAEKTPRGGDARPFVDVDRDVQYSIYMDDELVRRMLRRDTTAMVDVGLEGSVKHRCKLPINIDRYDNKLWVIFPRERDKHMINPPSPVLMMDDWHDGDVKFVNISCWNGVNREIPGLVAGMRQFIKKHKMDMDHNALQYVSGSTYEDGVTDDMRADMKAISLAVDDEKDTWDAIYRLKSVRMRERYNVKRYESMRDTLVHIQERRALMEAALMEKMNHVVQFAFRYRPCKVVVLPYVNNMTQYAFPMVLQQ
jgi:hypothetical protein